MNKYFLSMMAFVLLGLSSALAQTRIDGNFPFQSDPAKKYSIYVPSGYNPSIAGNLMVGFHPFNTSRWNSASWCDTLVDFAESNNLLLVCPDGGIDGRVDDPIDTAFTSVLLDSMSIWYNIDHEKVYAMGFSWGGRTTYTYGLSHIWRFGGLMPIGAVISGTNELNGLLHNATNKPFYLVHGSLDNPGVRFFPARDSLINRNAIENDTLLAGVGHTIDFLDRNKILSIAYNWIDSVNCANLTTGLNSNLPIQEIFSVYPNPATDKIVIESRFEKEQMFELLIYNATGEKIINDYINNKSFGTNFIVDTRTFDSGLYFIIIRNGDVNFMEKFFIR